MNHLNYLTILLPSKRIASAKLRRTTKNNPQVENLVERWQSQM